MAEWRDQTGFVANSRVVIKVIINQYNYYKYNTIITYSLIESVILSGFGHRIQYYQKKY